MSSDFVKDDLKAGIVATGSSLLLLGNDPSQSEKEKSKKIEHFTLVDQIFKNYYTNFKFLVID